MIVKSEYFLLSSALQLKTQHSFLKRQQFLERRHSSGGNTFISCSTQFFTPTNSLSLERSNISILDTKLWTPKRLLSLHLYFKFRFQKTTRKSQSHYKVFYSDSWWWFCCTWQRVLGRGVFKIRGKIDLLVFATNVLYLAPGQIRGVLFLVCGSSVKSTANLMQMGHVVVDRPGGGLL